MCTCGHPIDWHGDRALPGVCSDPAAPARPAAMPGAMRPRESSLRGCGCNGYTAATGSLTPEAAA